MTNGPFDIESRFVSLANAVLSRNRNLTVEMSGFYFDSVHLSDPAPFTERFSPCKPVTELMNFMMAMSQFWSNR